MVSRYQKRISGPLLDRIDLAQPTSRCRGWNTRSCRTTGWASPRRLSASGLGGDRPAARARHAARFEGTRMLANADAPGIQGFAPRRQGLGRGRCGTFAGWTTSQRSWDRQELA